MTKQKQHFQMNKRTKARHWVIYILIWVVYFTTLFCTASCKTKTVTQGHYITDNISSKVLDENWQERFISAFEQMSRLRLQEHETSIKEISHIKDSTSTAVDESGKVIKTENWHSEISTRDSKEALRLQDSVYALNKQVDKLKLFKYKCDSLIHLKQDSIQVLGRNLAKAEKRLRWADIIVVTIVSVFVIWLAVWRWHRKK